MYTSEYCCLVPEADKGNPLWMDIIVTLKKSEKMLRNLPEVKNGWKNIFP